MQIFRKGRFVWPMTIFWRKRTSISRLMAKPTRLKPRRYSSYMASSRKRWESISWILHLEGNRSKPASLTRLIIRENKQDELPSSLFVREKSSHMRNARSKVGLILATEGPFRGFVILSVKRGSPALTCKPNGAAWTWRGGGTVASKGRLEACNMHSNIGERSIESWI